MVIDSNSQIVGTRAYEDKEGCHFYSKEMLHVEGSGWPWDPREYGGCLAYPSYLLLQPCDGLLSTPLSPIMRIIDRTDFFFLFLFFLIVQGTKSTQLAPQRSERAPSSPHPSLPPNSDDIWPSFLQASSVAHPSNRVPAIWSHRQSEDNAWVSKGYLDSGLSMRTFS